MGKFGHGIKTERTILCFAAPVESLVHESLAQSEPRFKAQSKT